VLPAPGADLAAAAGKRLQPCICKRAIYQVTVTLRVGERRFGKPLLCAQARVTGLAKNQYLNSVPCVGSIVGRSLRGNGH